MKARGAVVTQSRQYVGYVQSMLMSLLISSCERRDDLVAEDAIVK